MKRYPERRRTPYEHAEEIQERFKYRDFTDPRWGRSSPPSPASSSRRCGAAGCSPPSTACTAVAQLRAEGHDIKDEDVARLSPLKDRHINFLGRYLFNIKATVPGQSLRPFRDPDAVEDDEDED